jgi:hypothetical protein
VPVSVVDKLDSFTSEFAIIPKEQCDFTKGKSVETNLLSCLNDWSSLVDLGKSVDMVFLDFAKAFDKVQINLLIAKLQMQGFSGLLAWIAHFLSDRTFAVKVNGVLSDFFDVLSEVPQGSVLGPKLFLLYTADIPGLFLLRCAMFADDIKLYSCPENGALPMHYGVEEITVNVRKRLNKFYWTYLVIWRSLKVALNRSIISK